MDSYGSRRIVESGGDMADFRYKAFVSYSWSDAAWGKWLHNALETYRTPRALIGKDGALGPVPARLHPLFKDREEEAAGASIGAAVEAALSNSEFLIVICSPRSAQSQWVNRELAWFKTHRDPAKILALIVDGNPGRGDETECFPAALTHRVLPDLTVTDERHDAPLAADARDSGDGKRNARLKLAATMLGVGLDELVNRDDRRRALRQRWVTAASLLFGGSMAGLAWLAVQARNEAQVQRAQAEGLVEFMITDLRKTLQPKVQIEVLGSIADRAKAFYAVQSRYPMDEEALARRSRVLKLLAALEVDRGDSDGSVRLFEQSVAASGELLARDPDNPERILDQAFALQGLGNVLFQRGDYAGAENRMQEAVRLTTHLVDDIERKDEWLSEQGSAFANLGIVQLQQRRFTPAAANLQKALSIKRPALAKKPESREGWPDFAATLAWAADAATQNGSDDEAFRYRLEEQKLYQTLLSEEPDDLITMSALMASQMRQADALLQQANYPAALALARQAIPLAETALRADPGNTVVGDDAAKAFAVLAEAELMAGNVSRAETAAARSEALVNKLVSTDPAINNWNGPMLGRARLVGIQSRARLASSRSACLAALRPLGPESVRLEKLSAARPSDAKLALVAAKSLLLRGDFDALSGKPNDALTGWNGGKAILRRLYGESLAIKDRAGTRLSQQIDQRLARGRIPVSLAPGELVCR